MCVRLTVSAAQTGLGKCLCRFVRCDCAESFCRWRTRMTSSSLLDHKFFQWVTCLFLCSEARTLTSTIKLDQHSGFYRCNTHISCSRMQPCRVGTSVILLYDRSLTGQTHTNIHDKCIHTRQNVPISQYCRLQKSIVNIDKRRHTHSVRRSVRSLHSSAGMDDILVPDKVLEMVKQQKGVSLRTQDTAAAL